MVLNGSVFSKSQTYQRIGPPVLLRQSPHVYAPATSPADFADLCPLPDTLLAGSLPRCELEFQPPPLLFGLISAPLGHLQGAFTLGCQSGHQELCIDSSRDRECGRMPHRRFKPFNSWRHKQMWQYRQEKQKENIPVTPICSGQSIQEQNNYSLIS